MSRHTPGGHEGARSIHAVDARHLASVVHEVTGCLSPVHIQISLLESGRLGHLTTEQARALEVIERNVERMRRILNDLLDLGLVEARRLRLAVKPTDLDALAREAVASYMESARQKDISLRHHSTGPVPLVADRERVLQVFSNLLANALRFTPPGGRVLIVTKARLGLAEAAVQDTGHGISEPHIARLFQPFVQVHDPETAPGGHGLGLYISRSIVEGHGGEIMAKSEGPGKGSTFIVRFPDRPPKDEH